MEFTENEKEIRSIILRPYLKMTKLNYSALRQVYFVAAFGSRFLVTPHIVKPISRHCGETKQSFASNIWNIDCFAGSQ